MPNIIDLRPNSDFTNLNFENYQFSSDINPNIEEKCLSKHALHIEPSSEQDSWLETRLFAFHNHLFQNPFDLSCWFYDENYQIWQIKPNNTLNLIYSFDLTTVNKNAIMFNPTISFACDDIAIITGIDNSLRIIMIPNNNEESHELFTINNIEAGVLLDSRLIKEKSLLIIAVGCIVESNKKKQSKLVIYSYLIKCVDKKVEDLDKLIQKQELMINGPIEYVYIESNGDFIDVLSQDMAKLTINSSKNEEEAMDHSNKNETTSETSKYYWSQDEDSLTVRVKIPIKYKGMKPNIKILPTKISVIIGNDVLVEGEFKFRIDHDTVVWNFEEDTLKIEIMKYESGLMWNELILNDLDSEYLPNEALAAEVHSRLSHLCTDQQDNNVEKSMIGFNSDQLEECDLEDKDSTLQRINLTTQTTTDLAIFGSHNRVLFAYKLKSYPIICSRYDNDGCIWKLTEDETKNWCITHATTFPGFGYVEASKCNKKFCISSPNFSYIAIIEHTKYGFLYERPNKDARVAKQRIIDLGSDSQSIIGAAATNENIILLTKDKLYMLKII